MKKILVTFGTQTWYNAKAKLIQSAKQFGLNGCVDYDETKIEQSFYDENKEIFKYRRGFGYWLWKPYIILKTLEQVDDGDIVFYSDSGSIIVNKFDDLFERCVQNNGILLFDNRDGTPTENDIWINKNWTKGDCFVMMNCDSDKYQNGNQVDACYQMYQKTPKSIEFIKEYLMYCKNINIVSDLPNINTVRPELTSFYQHRHDQSVLSLLSIKHNIHIEREPSQWGYRTESNQQNIKFYHHRNPQI
jgi:hypothetical protein